MKIKTDQEIVRDSTGYDKYHGSIPLEIWNDVVEYKLRQWVNDNVCEMKWAEFMKKLEKKIQNKKIKVSS